MRWSGAPSDHRAFVLDPRTLALRTVAPSSRPVVPHLRYCTGFMNW